MPDRKPPPTRDEIVQAIQHGMLFEGRKRASRESINAQVAAEKLSDALDRTNQIVVRGPPASAPATVSSSSTEVRHKQRDGPRDITPDPIESPRR